MGNQQMNELNEWIRMYTVGIYAQLESHQSLKVNSVKQNIIVNAINASFNFTTSYNNWMKIYFQTIKPINNKYNDEHYERKHWGPIDSPNVFLLNKKSKNNLWYSFHKVLALHEHDSKQN